MRQARPIAVLAVQTELLPLVREVLGSGGRFPLVARGDSMRPAIDSGDRILLAPLQGEPLREGELVLWDHGGKAVVHRVVARRRDEVQTRGDARAEGDGWVPLSSVVGRVVRVEPRPRPRRAARLLGLARRLWPLALLRAAARRSTPARPDCR